MTKYTIEIKNPSGEWVVFNKDYEFNWMSMATWQMLQLMVIFPCNSFRVGIISQTTNHNFKEVLV